MRLQVSVVAGPAAGHVLHFDRRDHVLVGRAPDAHLCVEDDLALSRLHFVLEVDPPHAYVRDLQSSHGTWVNGARVEEGHLELGDEIRGGNTVLRLDLITSDSGRVPSKQIGLACTQCSTSLDGVLAPREPDAVVFCTTCQRDLLERPILPHGHRLIRELGRGSMGAAYLTYDERLDVHRVVKQILPKAAMSARARSEFVREASMQARLDHPNIVRCFDCLEPARGRFSAVLEFVDGVSVDTLTGPGAPMDPTMAVAIVEQALEGLDFAHRRGVVHRDVKDANILVRRGGDDQFEVKLSDFGLAKSYLDAGGSGFTQTGMFNGTSAYMPIEQLTNYRNAGPTADIFAMGGTLYRLLTGEFPRDFSSGAHWIVVILEQPIVPIRERNPRLPAPLVAVVERAMATHPCDRFPSADAMRTALLSAWDAARRF